MTSGHRGQESSASGHRSVPHTADLCIEAWAGTREECIAEAVRGVIGSFTDTAGVAAGITRECELRADTDERLLAAVIEDVIYRMEAAAEVPADIRVTAADHGVRLRFTMVSSGLVGQIGAVPKAVSLHGLRLAHDAQGWAGRVTLDV
ncbi:archease [Streptomyces sp. NPDC048506]|uniref:archease n=1 Tax=Streptomyces sp. NPDC048506 TaxID=3155028 RepID=UPI003416B8E6